MTSRRLLQGVVATKVATRETWSRHFRRGADADLQACADAMIACTHAPTFAVAGDMVDLLDYAWITTPDYPLHPTDLLSPAGFALFEHPITLHPDDPAGRVHGLAWHSAPPTVGDGIIMSVFARVGEIDPDAIEPLGLFPMSMDRPWARWRFGDWSVPANRRWQLVASFFKLVADFVPSNPEPTDRAVRRQAIRADVDISDTVVVRLRRKRTHTDTEAGSAVEWSHRWGVSGHWRQQPYPSQNRIVPKWISPYIKGPEDKPFVDKSRRFDVDR